MKDRASGLALGMRYSNYFGSNYGQVNPIFDAN